jgi:hypothetical protein
MVGEMAGKMWSDKKATLLVQAKWMTLVSSIMTDSQDILKIESQAMGWNVQLFIVWVLLVEGRGGKERCSFRTRTGAKFRAYGGRRPPYCQKFYTVAERENPR